MKLIATLFFCIFVVFVNAQRKKKSEPSHKLSATELAIAKIDSSITAILKDTTLVTQTIHSLSKELEPILHDKASRKSPEIRDTFFNTMKAVWQNGKLVKLTIGNNSLSTLLGIYTNSQIKSIYFLNNKPVLLQQDLRSSMRMGSCGDVSTRFYHYFDDSTAFAGQQTGISGWYASCYGWILTKPDAVAFFKQVIELRKLLAAKASTAFIPITEKPKNNKHVNIALLLMQLKVPKEEILNHYGY